MGNDGIAFWISISSVLVTLSLGIIGFLRKSPLVAAGIADELRKEIMELTRRNSELHRENESLCLQNDALTRTVEFWRRQYEKSKNGQ